MSPNNQSNHPVLKIGLVVFFGVLTVAIVYGFTARDWLPPLASQHGAGVDKVIRYLIMATGGIFVIGHLALIVMIWKYGGSNNSTRFRASRKVEWIAALVPVFLMAGIAEVGILVIGQPVWEQLYGDEPEDAIEIEVVGRQFEWRARYPGEDGKFGRYEAGLVNQRRNPLGLVEEDAASTDDIVSGALHVPVGKPIVIHLRTQDVQHSFSVPQFRLKQDLVPGMPTRIQLVVTKEGEYEIACAELCGLGHYTMKGRVIAHPPEKYREWLKEQEGFFE